MSVNVNTASAQELKQAFARIGDIVTHLILDFRQKYGVVKREAVNLALRGNLPTQILDLMDFSEPYDDPFDLNLLPPVPKENSREPLRSSSKTQRTPVFKEPEVASTQGHSAWLAKASQDLDQELSEILAATSLRSYRTGFKSSIAKDVKVNHSSRSDQRSRSNSPHSEENILVKIERSFARLTEDTGAKKQEPCSYRTGFVSNIDKKENHATSGMSGSKQQAIKKEGNAGEASDKIKSGPGVNVAELSKDTRRPKSVRHKSRSTSRSPASRSGSRSRSDNHNSRKTDEYGARKSVKVHKKASKHLRLHSRSRSRSSSRSTSRSSSRSLHRPTKRGHVTKHSKSNGHRRHSSSGSRSPSRSRSHRTKRSKVHKRKPKRPSNSRSSSRSRSRSHERKRRSHKARRLKKCPSSSSDTDTSVHRHHRHGVPRKHPKGLRFDGKSNWRSFKKRFDSFRKVMKWSDTQCKDYLIWSLEDKALDFFTISIDVESYSFRKIMKKLEKRFGVQELTETSKVKFEQAHQEPEESIEDWADRVMTLAIPAFINFSDEYLNREAVVKFCQGCSDKSAAKHACFERPTTMEEALNLVKHHQYISQAIDGNQNRKEIISINAVRCLSEDHVSDNLEQCPSENRVEELIAAALQQFAERIQINSVQTERIADTKKRKTMQCFFCKKFGHVKKECKVYQAWLSKCQARADSSSN